jgi:DNA-binding IscR family transcriptional regulator
MILRTMEGDLSVVSPMDGQKESGDLNAHLVVNSVWQRIDSAIGQVVDHITLADLVDDYNRYGADNYFI